MKVDKVDRVVYNDPIVVRKLNPAKELDPKSLPHKTPLEVYGYTYDNKAQIGAPVRLLSTYA
jgi:hypothetical protein